MNLKEVVPSQEGTSPTSGHRLSPTTADLAVEAWGRTKEDVFREAALGLCSVMCDPQTVEPRSHLACQVEGEDSEHLFFGWLNEIVYLLETHCFLGCDVQIDQLRDTKAEGRIIGEPVDRERHALGLEVKAVTLHRLQFTQTPEGWKAYVILDV
jgi:SHS2 domain-containing protein